MKRILFTIISIISVFAHSLYAQENKAELSIKFYDRTMYYPSDVKDNPVYVHVTVRNTGTSTYRFKLADDRAFSMDFYGFNVKNSQLPVTDSLTRKRTTNNSVYFREISLEQDEEYSFVENLKDYLEIKEPSIYYIELKFYPELYKEKSQSLSSNRLSLEIRPSPSAATSNFIAAENKTQAVLQPEEISPDKVIEQTIIARQKSLWDQYFLYMDLEEILKREPSRNRRYNSVSAKERADMLESFKADLMLSRIDKDIVAIPSKFILETTTYTQNEGTVKVKQWFKNDTFYEVKRYTYYVRQRDGIWQIYDYSVDNLGTE